MRRFLCEAVRRCYLLAVLLAALPSSGNLSALHAAGRTTEHAETNCPSRAERGSIPKEGARGVPRDGISDHLVEFESPQDPKSQDIVVVLSEGCAADFDERLESQCFHPVASSTEKCISPSLPYLAYAESINGTSRFRLGHYKLSYAASIRRAIPLLKSEHGWRNINAVQMHSPEWWASVSTAQVVIIGQHDFASIVSCFPDKRYIIIMTNDAATLSQSTSCSLDDDRIIGLLAHTSLNPIFENNGPLVENRRHFAWLAKEQPFTIREDIITPTVAEKIHTIIPQIFRWRYPLDCGGRRTFTMLSQAFVAPMEQWLRPFEERPYDIAFVGLISESTQDTRDSNDVNAHRAKAMEAIENLHARYPHLKVFKAGHRLVYSKFISLLRDTKIFVSPFGLGEFSGKDYEAVLSGSLLVKPYADKLIAYPNIYDRMLALNVGINFAGLEETVIPYLSDPKLAMNRARRGLALLRDHSSVENYANDLDKVLTSAVGRKAKFDKRGCPGSHPFSPHVSR